MLDIYRGENVIASAVITSNAEHKVTLMKEDYVKIDFVSDVKYNFRTGDRVTYHGQDYYLGEDYEPSMSNELTYRYELQFNAPWYNLDNFMFLFYTVGDGGVVTSRESEWTITDTAANVLRLVVQNMADNTRGSQCEFDNVYCEPTEVKSFSFQSQSILGALNAVAQKYELEWWVEKNSLGFLDLYMGECDSSVIRSGDGAVEFDNGKRKKDTTKAKLLTIGEDVSYPTVKQGDELKQRYYVYGSSRNVDQTCEFGGNKMSISTKRLALADNPQVKDDGSGEEVVVFDDIYPKSDYKIGTQPTGKGGEYGGVKTMSIRTDEAETYNEDGTAATYKYYDAYQICIPAFSDYVFSKIKATADLPADDVNRVDGIEDMIASGKKLMIKFIEHTYTDATGTHTHTPKLAGWEFEVHAVLEQDADGGQHYEFQLIHQDINGYIVPNAALAPFPGDKDNPEPDEVCVYNLKAKYVLEADTTDAQDRLRKEFDKYYANKKKSVTYTVKPYVDRLVDLSLGQAVRFKYGDAEVVSRVSGFEKRLDFPQVATYSISSYTTKGTVNSLKDEVKTINAVIGNPTPVVNNGKTIMGSSFDRTQVRDEITKYGGALFLSKLNDDTARGRLEFLKGVDITGGAATDEVVNSGMISTQDLTVTGLAHFFKLSIDEIKATGGAFLATPASGFTIAKVEVSKGTESAPTAWKVYWRAEQRGAMTLNEWLVGDQAICATFNAAKGLTSNAGNKYWWRLVTDSSAVVDGVFPFTFPITFDDAELPNGAVLMDDPETGERAYFHWIEVSNAAGEYDGDGAPQAGDTVVQLGSRVEGDPERASAIYYSAYSSIDKGLKAPLLAFYEGVNDFDLESHHVTYFSHGKHQFTGNLTATSTFDGKPLKKIFYEQPLPPYNEGDLWVNAKFPNISSSVKGAIWIDIETGKQYKNGEIFNNDVARCKRAKKAGEAFNVWDWQMASAASGATISELKADNSKISASVTDISNGLKRTGIDITNGFINISADTTRFTDSTGNQTAVVTADGLQSAAVLCYANGQPRVKLDVDGLKYYYPNGQVMREEVFVFDDSTGSLKGMETRYYDVDGNIIWRLDDAGTLNKGEIKEYWTTESACLYESMPTGTEWQAKDYKPQVNGYLSTFHSANSSEAGRKAYDGMKKEGAISSMAVTADTTWFTGYLLVRRIATWKYEQTNNESDYYTYYWSFEHFVSGKLAGVETLEFRDDPQG